jgi:ribonuclease HI
LKEVALYTDGSCSGNPGPGGWGVILVYGDHERTLSGSESKTTNNRMELRAVAEGLRALTEPCRVSVYSDSRYVVNAFNKDWFAMWERNGWKTVSRKPVRNKDLWEELRTQIPLLEKSLRLRYKVDGARLPALRFVFTDPGRVRPGNDDLPVYETDVVPTQRSELTEAHSGHDCRAAEV